MCVLLFMVIESLQSVPSAVWAMAELFTCCNRKRMDIGLYCRKIKA